MNQKLIGTALTLSSLFLLNSQSFAQGWQALSRNRLIAIQGVDNTTSYTGNQMDSIRIGVGTDMPTQASKMTIYSNREDSHLEIAGLSPSIRFTDKINPDSSQVGRGWLGVAGLNNSFTEGSLPGDFVLQNRDTLRSLIFSTGVDCDVHFEGKEQMRIDSRGYVGINTAHCNRPFSLPLDRLDVYLNSTDSTQEYVRFENMPKGRGNIVVIGNDGRLYQSAQVARPAGSNDETSDQIKDLQQQINDLKAQLATLKDGNTISNIATAGGYYLDQNTPNPFNYSTSIKYGISRDFNNAAVIISDMQGKIISNNIISAKGDGTVRFDASNFASGNYLYSLIIDGHTVESKKMVFIKN